MIGNLCKKTFSAIRIPTTQDSTGAAVNGADQMLATGIPGMRGKARRETLDLVNSQSSLKASAAIILTRNPNAEPYDILQDDATGQRRQIVYVDNPGDQSWIFIVYVTEDFTSVQRTTPPA